MATEHKQFVSQCATGAFSSTGLRTPSEHSNEENSRRSSHGNKYREEAYYTPICTHAPFLWNELSFSTGMMNYAEKISPGVGSRVSAQDFLALCQGAIRTLDIRPESGQAPKLNAGPPSNLVSDMAAAVSKLAKATLTYADTVKSGRSAALPTSGKKLPQKQKPVSSNKVPKGASSKAGGHGNNKKSEQKSDQKSDTQKPSREQKPATEPGDAGKVDSGKSRKSRKDMTPLEIYRDNLLDKCLRSLKSKGWSTICDSLKINADTIRDSIQNLSDEYLVSCQEDKDAVPPLVRSKIVTEDELLAHDAPWSDIADMHELLSRVRALAEKRKGNQKELIPFPAHDKNGDPTRVASEFKLKAGEALTRKHVVDTALAMIKRQLSVPDSINQQLIKFDLRHQPIPAVDKVPKNIYRATFKVQNPLTDGYSKYYTFVRLSGTIGNANPDKFGVSMGTELDSFTADGKEIPQPIKRAKDEANTKLSDSVKTPADRESQSTKADGGSETAATTSGTSVPKPSQNPMSSSSGTKQPSQKSTPPPNSGRGRGKLKGSRR